MRPRRCRGIRCSPPGGRTLARCSSSSPALPTRSSSTTTSSSRKATDAARPNPGRHSRRPRPGGPAAPGRRRRARAAGAGRSKPAGARLPRPRPPGRGGARRDPPPARRRPDARAADIVVMCPDIEVFAPLIHATFGTGAAETNRTRCRRRDADRPARAPRRPLAAPDQPGARCRRPAARPRRRPADRLAGARLGGARAGPPALPPRRRRPDADRAVGARRRRALGPRCGAACLVPARPAAGQHVAGGLGSRAGGRGDGGGGTAAVRGVLPLDDVGSGDIDLAGRFAEFLERLHAIVDAFADPMPLDAWAAAIAEAADSLTAAPAGRRGSASSSAACSRTSSPRARPPAWSRRRRWRCPRSRAARRPAAWPTDPGELPHRAPHHLHARPDAVGAAPRRLPDGTRRRRLPRQTARDGDDLLLLDPHVGDRDARSEDRQLLLDAVLAATDHLVITYAARDERTNLRRPPAVPLGELLDVVDRTARFPDAATTRERVIVEHPLQPFDLRNFDAGALVPERTWSFDRIALDGARPSRAARSARRRSSPGRCRPSRR